MSLVRKWFSRIQAAVAHPRTFRFLLGQVCWRTGCGRWTTFRVRDLRLGLFPTNLSWQLWLEPASRNHLLDLIDRLVGVGDTVVDVGANIGLVSLAAARRVGPDGVVHAIEPHPRTARYLQANLDLNHATQVRCHTVAVGAQSGFCTLTDDRRDDMNYMRASKDEGSPGHRVKVMPLDELLPSLPRCRLLKLDVEGRELECLEGGPRTLERCEVILVEAGDPNSMRFGVAAAHLHHKLTEQGFQVFAWEQNRLESVQLDKYRNSVGDWIAARDPEQVRLRLAPK